MVEARAMGVYDSLHCKLRGHEGHNEPQGTLSTPSLRPLCLLQFCTLSKCNMS